MNYDIFSLSDFIAVPIWLGLILLFAVVMRDSRYRADMTAHYFMPALVLKLIGGVLVGLIYTFYYKGGDTLNYFINARVIAGSLVDDPSIWWRLMNLSDRSDYINHPDLQVDYLQHLYYARDVKTFVVVKITSLANVLSLNSYLGSSLIMSFASFIGVWMMYRTFVYQYPKLHRELAIAVLFIPSVFFWGSGILKDSVTIGLLGLLLYSIHRIFMLRSGIIPYTLLALFASYLLFFIKAYILISFLPLVAFWVGLTYLRNIGSPLARTFFAPAVLGIFLFVGLQLTTVISEETGRYSVNRVFDTASAVSRDLSRDYYYFEGRGSRYDIGDFDPSPLGLILKFPEAVSYTFFRPFPWEAHNFVTFLAAIESLVIMYWFARAVWRTGPRRFFATLIDEPFLVFCFFYSIMFAFMVGLTSGNYGNLVRYKIPCIPFFVASFLIAESLAKQRLAEAAAPAKARPTLRSARARMAAQVEG